MLRSACAKQNRVFQFALGVLREPVFVNVIFPLTRCCPEAHQLYPFLSFAPRFRHELPLPVAAVCTLFMWDATSVCDHAGLSNFQVGRPAATVSIGLALVDRFQHLSWELQAVVISVVVVVCFFDHDDADATTITPNVCVEAGNDRETR